MKYLKSKEVLRLVGLVTAGELAEERGGAQGRLRRHLPAHGVRAAHRDAGVRSYRCRAQRRLRWILRRVPGPAYPGLQVRSIPNTGFNIHCY